MLQFLLLLPICGAVAVMLFGVTPRIALWGAFSFSLLSLALAIAAFAKYAGEPLTSGIYDVSAPWISGLGVNLHFGYDGMSLLFILLTSILTPVAILVAGFTIKERLTLYLALLLFLEGALIGVFLALDLVVFYFYWEAVLIPAYFLIGMWGGERRIYAAFKYVIYTMVGSLLMLVGILLLYAQSHSFNLLSLTGQSSAPIGGTVQDAAFLAFALAFGIKAAVFPFHSWVPDVYTESAPPTAIIMAGVLSKMGIYGFLRLCLPLFPDASRYFAPSIMVLAVIGIVYGALLALDQTDIKRLVACSSIAHLGFITLGVFSLTTIGIQGSTLQAVNHGIIIGALFALVAIVAARWGTTDLAQLGGLATRAPILAAVFLVVTLASLGLPGLNGFAGEFLVLTGTFQTHVAGPVFGVVVSVIGTVGVVLAAAYMLRLFQGAEHGALGPAGVTGPSAAPAGSTASWWSEMSVSQYAALLPLIVLMAWIGIAPGGWLGPTSNAVHWILTATGGQP